MLFNCFLKESVVYVPTVVMLQTGAYMDIEPVAAVPAADAGAIRRAFLEAIEKGNAVVPNPAKDDWPPPVLLKYANAKSWRAFQRGAAHWNIYEKNGIYRIAGHRTHPKGYWEQDPDQKINFQPGSTIDEVVDRMIALLQDAARK